jgi:hypothetical protein
MALNIRRAAGPMLPMQNFFPGARCRLDPSDGSFERREFGIDASSETGGSIARMRVVTALRARS